MPEPLFEIRVPSREGVSLAVWFLAGRQGLWMVDVIVDGFAVRSAACTFQDEALRLATDCAAKLAEGSAVEGLPLAAIPAHRVRPEAQIVDVASMGASPSARAYFANGLPYGQDNDPDGGVFI